MIEDFESKAYKHKIMARLADELIVCGDCREWTDRLMPCCGVGGADLEDYGITEDELDEFLR